MADMNKVILAGRIGTDINAAKTQSGISYCNFRLAVNRPKAKSEERAVTDWVNITAWRNTADYISKYFAKGRKVLLEGALRTRTYEKDDRKTTIVEVVVDNIFPADSAQSTAPAKKEAAPAVEDFPEGDGLLDAEDMPF